MKIREFTGAQLEMAHLDSLVRVIKTLAPGVTELGCHPGQDSALISMYVAERQREVEVLCDPRVREGLAAGQVQLGSFEMLSRAGRSRS